VTWWHGEHDRNAPLTAVRRIIAQLPNARLVVWPDAGHLTAYRLEGDILDELLA
jgi:pimeloyl-ACP methyl ester carboxylesterase